MSITERLAPVLAELAAGAVERERTGRAPHAEVAAIAQTGLLLARAPLAEGGEELSLRELTDIVISIARADSSVAQALRSSLLTADVLADPAALTVEERTRLLDRIRAGQLFAGTRNERGGQPGGIATRLRRNSEGEGYRLDGQKFYSTGALYAHWFSGSAVDEDGQVLTFTVPTDRDGVQVLDDFDSVGQRFSASGSTVFTDVRVATDEVVPEKQGGGGFSAFAQLYLAAVEAGIARAAHDDAVAFARNGSRPIKHAGVSRSVDDPYVRRAVGDIGARAFAARAAVLIAAEELDALVPGDDDHRAAVASRVAESQVVAVESALAASERLFDVAGGSAVLAEHGLDRHWRNARTVANHNPREWKLAVAGAFALTGEHPPRTGLF
ncbi:MAG: acyl-CoA dehydrogenase family protein [Mycetocola sp.]